MNQTPASPNSRPLVAVFLPWLLVVALSGLCWKFYTAFQESNTLATNSMDQEKAVGEYLGGLMEEAKAKITGLEKTNATLTKQVEDAEATTVSWREQFNTLGLSLADSEQARQDLARKLAEASKAPPQASN